MDTTVGDRTEAIDEAECRALLRHQRVGRIAYVAGDRPTILPVDFMLLDDRVVFRTDPGAKLSNVPLHQVCFEVDGEDDRKMAWSVVVHGLARDVTGALNQEYEQLRHALLPSHAPLADPHWIAIEIEEISGRRLNWS